VLINMAITADGKIATANRAISTFSSPRDHAHLLELRATADAVMAGARTVEAGAITLNAGGARYEALRRARGLEPQNLRVIVSGTASINPRAHAFRYQGSPLIVLTSARAAHRRLAALQRAGPHVHIHVCDDTGIDLPAALRWLRAQWGVRRLVCEGGARLNAAMLAAELVDEVHLTLCPLIFGGRGAPTIADGPETPRLADATSFQLISRRVVDAEAFLVYRVRRRKPRRPAAC
jgi:riboflavin-specific deaminase-like protein